ncbi:hypothetical protein BHE74_00040412 [Ensete ventricosum]|nr:hypothetical protein BHE74_00040412 [Ensete ventricosum]
MKNSWNDMIPLLPLQEFMPLTSVQGKLRASALCSIFYVDSLHAAWILHQVPLKSLCSSICIELIVALASTIPRVSPLLSSISTSTLISEITIPFGLLRLADQLVPCSALANALARLRLFANTIPTTPFKTAVAFTSLVAAAIPTLLAMQRAATSLARLADTATEELPSTMAAIRLSGMEISDLTLELSDLRYVSI